MSNVTARIVAAQDALAALHAHDSEYLRTRTAWLLEQLVEALEFDRARLAARAELAR